MNKSFLHIPVLYLTYLTYSQLYNIRQQSNFSASFSFTVQCNPSNPCRIDLPLVLPSTTQGLVYGGELELRCG